MFFHMLYHKIGHFVFYLVIGSRVKKRWVARIYPGSSCVTRYAIRDTLCQTSEAAWRMAHGECFDYDHRDGGALSHCGIFSLV
jgi:hypothetical protein